MAARKGLGRSAVRFYSQQATSGAAQHARPHARPHTRTHARTQARTHTETDAETDADTHGEGQWLLSRALSARAPATGRKQGEQIESKRGLRRASRIDRGCDGSLRFYVTDEPKLTSAGDRLCQVSPKLAFAALIAEIEGSRRIRRHRRLTMIIKAPRQQRSLNSCRNGPYDMPSSSSLPCDPSLDGREELTLCPVSHRVTSHHVGGAGRLTSLPAPCLTATAWLRDCMRELR